MCIRRNVVGSVINLWPVCNKIERLNLSVYKNIRYIVIPQTKSISSLKDFTNEYQYFMTYSFRQLNY